MAAALEFFDYSTTTYDKVYSYDSMGNITRLKQNIVNLDNQNLETQSTADIQYTYSNTRLSGITTDSQRYSFVYDAFGRLANTRVGTTILSSNTWSNNNLLLKQTYGNGFYRSYGYDKLDRVNRLSYNGSTVARYVYDATGRLGIFKDYLAKNRTRYAYDLSGRLTEAHQTAGVNVDAGDTVLRMRYTYDEGKDRVKSYWLQMPNSTGRDYFTSFYSYGTDAANRDRVVGLYSEWGSSPSTATGYTNDITYTYDSFGRMTARKLNTVTPFTTTYDYWDASRLRQIQNGSNKWNYDYDIDGNINFISYNGRYSRLYDYDSAGQLIREFDYDANTLILYTYDNRGNIVTKKTYPNMDKTATPVTDTYLYNYTNCRDTLLNYNGTSINYDAIGNPSNWRDGLTFGWINGRQLGTVKKNNTAVGTYTYDSTGMRIKKTAGGVTTTYHVMNGVCYGETRSDGKNLQYVFDENGRVIGFRVQESGGSSRYYFVFNAQGDVVQLLHANGKVYANYTYDTWGRCTVTSGTGGTLSATDIGNINPFRYRGYYYDTETGLYYLQSRYYDPVVGRFVNADSSLGGNQSVVGNNLFAYCSNNPVNYCDPDGRFVITGTVALLIIDIFFVSAIAVVGTYALTEAANHLTDGSSALSIPAATDNIIKFPKLPKNKSDSDKSITVAPVPLPRGNNRQEPLRATYYHVTDGLIAQEIMVSGIIHPGEAGFVYAWRFCPDRKAIKASGARYIGKGSVVISFETAAVFTKDPTVF